MIIAISGYESYLNKRGIAGTLKKKFPDQVDIIDPCTDIVSRVSNYDVFINNHYDWDNQGHQIDTLNALWNKWKNLKKIIVCISATSQDYQIQHDDIIGQEFYNYNVYKTGLDYACKQLQHLPREQLGHKCRVINIKPGWIDTPLSKDDNYKGHKMKPEYIADVIMWVIEQPEYVKTLTIAEDYLNADSK